MTNQNEGKKKGLVQAITDSQFEKEVIESEIPVFVDFWAPWCGPCRMVAPIVEELASEYQGRVKFVKMNVDENPQVAGAMGIRSIPTLVIFKGREVADYRIGAVPAEDLRRMIDKALGTSKGFLSKLFS